MLFRSGYLASGKRAWQKTLGTGGIFADRPTGMLYCRHCLVYGRIRSEYRPDRVMDGTALVCCAVCRAGFDKTGVGAVAQLSVDEDYKVVLRRINGIPI